MYTGLGNRLTQILTNCLIQKIITGQAMQTHTHTHTHTHMLRAVSNIIHESRLTPQKCEINKNVSNCIEQLINSKMTFKTTAALLYM